MLGMSEMDRFRAPQVDSETLDFFGNIAPDCRELWLRNLGVWHAMLGVWHAMLGVWHAMLGVWYAMLGVWLRWWGNPHLV